MKYVRTYPSLFRTFQQLFLFLLGLFLERDPVSFNSVKRTSKLNEYLGSHTPVRKRNVFEEFFREWENGIMRGGEAVKGTVAGNMGNFLLE
jgi:hypothetical protein